MIYKHLVICIINLIIWQSINISQIYAYHKDCSNPCYCTIDETGNDSLNNIFTGDDKHNDIIDQDKNFCYDCITKFVNDFNLKKCDDNSYKVYIKEGTYQLNKTDGTNLNIFYSFYEPDILYHGISFSKIKNNIDIIGDVNENNEPITTLKCPGYGYMGFIDVVYYNKKVTFKNIRFTGCYNHWFKIHHFKSFHDQSDSPEYIFENCVFEKNYDESIFLYEYLAGDT